MSDTIKVTDLVVTGTIVEVTDRQPSMVGWKTHEVEVERAIAAEREACAALVEAITQARIPEPFRKAGVYVGESSDGWRPLTRDEKCLLRGIAEKIRARGNEPT